MDVAVIARVPFDEGTLTGNADQGQPRGPKATGATRYFVPENLNASVERAELLKPAAAAAG